MTASHAAPATVLTTRAQAVSAEIVADILTLVRHEAGSYDLPALASGLDLLRDLAVTRLGPPDHEHRHPGGAYGDTLTLTYRGTGSGTGHVALVGHYDTVWPAGTLAGWEQPESTDEDGRARLSGPGIFDMKTGLAQGIWALKLARENGAPVPTVTFLFNGDEEIGSLASRPVIEETAKKADATLVLEPTAHGAVKTARKGTGIFKVKATGVESHAGLAPQDGASAILALSEFVVAAAAVAAPERGTTVNAGLVSGGSAVNVVAGSATAGIDIRVASEVARDQGRPHLPDAAVGGASDANFIAALGLPVLCGMGAVGDGAHARGEYIHPDTVPAQTALVAGLLTRLTGPLRG
ncbi:M20/M25/M40 family metallo-hydrolase [Streptomyces europaeiscabiei]|uniref:M20/M25/M40 family metallo-hydrolase n=1 Tax=Streptomyces europaeiscabiei TaxID=146819 RepID=A0AAJ2UPI6_9ACTN|nr:M20/M25/M40 family metallo-hydrolase [Streptomyces europaeiscabiei]MDX3134683.1 M20/M25/M40 family metallo-hydrolase [Streptomyces europaeiscabiei]